MKLPQCRKVKGVVVNTRAALNESPSVGDAWALGIQSSKRREFTVQPLAGVYRFLNGPHATVTRLTR
jgi:hypothetical protein